MKKNHTETEKKALKIQQELLSKISKKDSYMSDLINVSPSTYNRFKNGRNLMSWDKFMELDSTFKLDADYLLGRKPCSDNFPQNKLNQLNSKISSLNRQDADFLLDQFTSQYNIFVEYKKSTPKNS